jgi:hypothetical protein
MEYQVTITKPPDDTNDKEDHAIKLSPRTKQLHIG